MSRVLQDLSSHTQGLPYVGNFSLQIALSMSNKDNLPCLKRHKAGAKIVVSRATNWSGLFLSALGLLGLFLPICLCEHLLLQSHSLYFPWVTLHPLLVEIGHRKKDCWQNTKYHRAGVCKKQKKKNFSVTTVVLLKHSINPSHAAHSFPNALVDCAHLYWKFVKGWNLFLIWEMSICQWSVALIK